MERTSEYDARQRKAEEFSQVLYAAGVRANTLLDMPPAVWSLACAVVSQKYRAGRPVGIPSVATQAQVLMHLTRRERNAERRPDLYALPSDPLEGLPQ